MESCSNQKSVKQILQIATLCLDDSFAYSWHSLNQLHLECFSNSLEGVQILVRFDIPIRIWQKILESVIEPIALYGCKVWGPLTSQEFTKWDKHQIETLHAEFCKISTCTT